MKKVIFATFLVLSTISFNTANAQSIGLRFGTNLSDFKFNADSLKNIGVVTEKLRGLALAIPIEFRVHKNISIQTELGFLQKAFTSYQNVNSGSTTVKEELKNYSNYASIPVMLKLHTKKRFIQGYVNIGPDAAWKMSAKQTGTRTTTTSGQSNTTDVNNTSDLSGTTRLAIGLQGGAGVKLRLGKAAVFLDGRFLTDLKDSNGNFNFQGLKEKYSTTQGWMTSLGLQYNFW